MIARYRRQQHEVDSSEEDAVRKACLLMRFSIRNFGKLRQMAVSWKSRYAVVALGTRLGCSFRSRDERGIVFVDTIGIVIDSTYER